MTNYWGQSKSTERRCGGRALGHAAASTSQMGRFETEAKWLMAALLRQHTSKNGFETLISAKIGRNDRHDVDFAFNIVVLKLRGVVWPELRAPSGKYRLNSIDLAAPTIY